MIAGNSTFKLAGYPLAFGMPLLAPLGVWLGIPWLAPLIVFGFFPVLGLVLGEDHSLPVVGLRRSRWLVIYLDSLPRIYAAIWIATLTWAAVYVAEAELSGSSLAWLIVSVGIGSAVAICTAHELMHRRSPFDVLLGRFMAAFCVYGHMYVEHLHHHATLGDVAAGETAPRGSSIYQFAPRDFAQGLRNAWRVESSRLRRCGEPWWHNRMLQDYGLALALVLGFAMLGGTALILFIGQAVFAVYCFEVITYVHHYGLVRGDGEEPGPQHAWAHHCWITNCLTFNNTFHSDHHLRPETPYYELHAMYGAPRLPASYFTMFCVALVPPLWRKLMDRRLDALAETGAQAEARRWLYSQHCR
jgi:alkane 1-monooxygenase